MSRSVILASCALCSCILASACRHQTPAAEAPAAAPSSHVREYCWWAVLRSRRTPDSVAARFRRAYSELRLARITTGTWGDTVWAHAGPTWVSTNTTNASYESGAVAYSRGDSTHFRYYVTIAAPPGGWIRQSDSVEANRRDIDFCADIARHAAIGWTAPNEPTGEESLSVWNANPWSAARQDSATHED